ncbi:MAG: DUF2141 domain-containing protein [Pseudomonadota bacterium]|nr:DUF2141 domain-containing protein [Pseudomonadota bacterium]
MKQGIGLAAALLTLSTGIQAADLTVQLTGIKSADGTVLVQLFTDPAQFPDGTADQEIRLPASEDGVAATFTGLAPGTYAVGAYHDANENGKLDANFMGMPTEDVGNSGEVALAKPGFEKSSFELGEQDHTISFVLR